MKKRKPIDHSRNIRRSVPQTSTPSKKWYNKVLLSIKNFLIYIGNIFKKGYQKYDSFIKRIFKLEDIDDDKIIIDKTERLPYSTNKRNTKYNSSPLNTPNITKSDTQDYGHIPSYLKQKQSDDDLKKYNIGDLDNLTDEEHHQHMNIFKKRQKPRSFATSILMSLI